MNYIINIEGQRIPVDAAIGANDDLVRKTLAPIYPQVSTASITRTAEGETTVIQVIKKAGTKGASPAVAYLNECKGGQNPAVALLQEIQRSQDQPASLAVLIALDQKIEAAVKEGLEQANRMSAAGKRLKAARPQPAPGIPWGF